MQEFSLPSPNIGGKGHHLRRIMAQCISYIEVNALNYTGAAGVAGRHPSADEFKTFLDACNTAIAPFIMGTPVTDPPVS